MKISPSNYTKKNARNFLQSRLAYAFDKSHSNDNLKHKFIYFQYLVRPSPVLCNH